MPLALTRSAPRLSPPPFTKNFKASNTERLRRALREGGKAVWHGDSTTTGYQGGPVANAFKLAVPGQIAGLLRAKGIDAMAQYRYSTGGTSETIGPSDNRITATGGWQTNAGFTLGGGLLACTAAGTLTFAPDEPTNLIELIYTQHTTAGSFTYSLDGAAPVTVNTQTGSPNKVATISLPTTLGMHSLLLTWASGTVYANGFGGLDTTRKCLNIINAGSRASSTARETQVDQAYRALPMVQQIKPDFILHNLCINDAGSASVTAAVFRANVISYINANIANSDIVLVAPHHVQAGFYTGTFESQYTYSQQFQRFVDILYDLSAIYDLPLSDLYSFVDDWGTFNSRKFFGDSAHPLTSGYADIARVQADSLSYALQAFG